MNLFSGLAELIERGRRMRAYTRARNDAEAMTDADLADAGLKRWQLGHVTRVKVLR